MEQTGINPAMFNPYPANVEYRKISNNPGKWDLTWSLKG
jgi:hypothetical protein